MGGHCPAHGCRCRPHSTGYLKQQSRHSGRWQQPVSLCPLRMGHQALLQWMHACHWANSSRWNVGENEWPTHLGDGRQSARSLPTLSRASVMVGWARHPCSLWEAKLPLPCQPGSRPVALRTSAPSLPSIRMRIVVQLAEKGFELVGLRDSDSLASSGLCQTGCAWKRVLYLSH